MTNSNGNNSGDRLSRIEAIVESNSRLLQAMLEQRETDRLDREERMARLEAIAANHEERMRFLEETQRQLVQTQQGIANLVASLDDDRPTILRRLMAIENKVDTLIERER